jgi:hypothetical protein
MNATVIPLLKPRPPILKPSPRIMRREGRTSDPAPGGTRAPLNEGETSLNWTPKLTPLYSMPFADSETVRAGNAFAIVRDGYEEDPLGIVTNMYRPLVHEDTARDIAEGTFGRTTPEGAQVDGHGYHVVHADTLATMTVNDLPIVSRLMLVHDHTGAGSVRASVVCYLGNEIVIGSKNFTRRLHVGAGARDMGAGSRSRWLDVVDAMLETAMVQQDALAECLTKGVSFKMTEDAAACFERHAVFVERAKLTQEEKDRGVIASIIPPTALDVVIAHHKSRRGAGNITWGVWSRRLEGEALSALIEITGVSLPRKGGR